MDGLVKNAYENWMHVIEYDDQTLLDIKQNQNTAASQTDIPTHQQDFLNSYDHQVTLPTLSVPVPPEWPPRDTGPTAGGTMFKLRIIIACITNSQLMKLEGMIPFNSGHSISIIIVKPCGNSFTNALVPNSYL